MTEIVVWTIIAWHIFMIMLGLKALFFTEYKNITTLHKHEHSHVFISQMLLNIFFIFAVYTTADFSPWLYLLAIFYPSVEFLMLSHTCNESNETKKYSL